MSLKITINLPKGSDAEGFSIEVPLTAIDAATGVGADDEAKVASFAAHTVSQALATVKSRNRSSLALGNKSEASVSVKKRKVSDSGIITLRLQTIVNRVTNILIEKGMKISELKEAYETQTGIRPVNQHLFYGGEQLSDNRTVGEVRRWLRRVDVQKKYSLTHRSTAWRMTAPFTSSAHTRAHKAGPL